MLAVAGPPQPGQVVLAAICVALGILGAVAGAMAGWRGRNRLAYVFALGSALFAAGIVGQRSFPSADAVRKLGSGAAATSAPGPFDAGVTIPVVHLQLTPVALAGILIAAVGVSLLLIFEPTRPGREPGPALPPLQDQDTT